MRVLLLGSILLAAALTASGCDGAAADGSSGNESTETTPGVNYGMAGAPKDVIVSRAALESTPTAPVLDTPESAVRSYLDWISYGYRTAQPAFAEPTMTESEAVRVDAYNEYNLQKDRIIDQSLAEITFGEPVIEGGTATISTVEHWAYRYVSLTEAGKTIEGPLEATYEAVYSLVRGDGGWIVDAVKVERTGESE